MDTVTFVDIAIVGGGIAGAALAHRLVPHVRVAVLERESQPGAHSTGRSAAMFMESYGPVQARALTRASRGFFLSPPAGFSPTPLVAPRGVLYVARPGEEAAMARRHDELAATGARVSLVDGAEACRRVPVLRPQTVAGAVAEDGALDIDVHALLQGFVRGARAAGARWWASAELAAGRWDGRRWSLTLADGRRLEAGRLVDAAGAWADEVARRCGVAPLGVQPRRRSAFTFAAPEGLDVAGWPTVAALDHGWYFKPDAGRLLGSPANADPVEPHDVQPEEIDIATGIARIEAATTMTIRRPLAAWAGLRSFAPDEELVIGPAPDCDGFHWLAGQGGYGIQSAPAAAMLAGALLLGEPLAPSLQREGVTAQAMSPARLLGGAP